MPKSDQIKCLPASELTMTEAAIFTYGTNPVLRLCLMHEYYSGSQNSLNVGQAATSSAA